MTPTRGNRFATPPPGFELLARAYRAAIKRAAAAEMSFMRALLTGRRLRERERARDEAEAALEAARRAIHAMAKKTARPVGAHLRREVAS